MHIDILTHKIVFCYLEGEGARILVWGIRTVFVRSGAEAEGEGHQSES